MHRSMHVVSIGLCFPLAHNDVRVVAVLKDTILDGQTRYLVWAYLFIDPLLVQALNNTPQLLLEVYPLLSLKILLSQV